MNTKMMCAMAVACAAIQLAAMPTEKETRQAEMSERRPIIKELHDLTDQGLQWKVTKKCILAQLRVQSVYLDRVKAAQRRDPQLQKIMYEVQQGQSRDFVVDREGTLRLGTRLCVPNVDELRKEIMEEAHFSAYSIHPGSTKMCLIAQFRVRSVYLDRVKATQRRDPQLQKIMYDV